MERKWRFKDLLESDWFKGGIDGKVVNIRDFSSIKLCEILSKKKLMCVLALHFKKQKSVKDPKFFLKKKKRRSLMITSVEENKKKKKRIKRQTLEKNMNIALGLLEKFN